MKAFILLILGCAAQNSTPNVEPLMREPPSLSARNTTIAFEKKVRGMFDMLDLEYNHIACPPDECTITSDKFTDVCINGAQDVPSHNCDVNSRDLCSPRLRRSMSSYMNRHENYAVNYASSLVCCSHGEFRGGRKFYTPLCFEVNKTQKMIKSCPITTFLCEESYTQMTMYKTTVESVMSMYNILDEDSLYTSAKRNYTLMKQGLCNWMKFGIACEVSTGEHMAIYNLAVVGGTHARHAYVIYIIMTIFAITLS